jgi:hypothetical protein
MKNRLLIVSSHRMEGFESPDTQAVYERYSFSLGAIGYHLEQMGWETQRVGLAGWRRWRQGAQQRQRGLLPCSQRNCWLQ